MGKVGNLWERETELPIRGRAPKGGLFKSRRVFGYAIRARRLGLDQPMYL